MPMTTDPERRAAQAADKEARAHDRIIAMQEYEAGQAAKRENMARLRALREAKEAGEVLVAKPKARARKSVKLVK